MNYSGRIICCHEYKFQQDSISAIADHKQALRFPRVKTTFTIWSVKFTFTTVDVPNQGRSAHLFILYTKKVHWSSCIPQSKGRHHEG